MNSSTPPNIPQLAGKLTKAQREVIANAWPYPDYHRQGEQVSFCPVWTNDRNRAALDRKGLIASRADGGPRLTPLGLQVKAHLEQESR